MLIIHGQRAGQDSSPDHIQFPSDRSRKVLGLNSVPDMAQLSSRLWGLVCLMPWGRPGRGTPCSIPTLQQALVMFTVWFPWYDLNLVSLFHSDRAFLWIQCSASVDLDFHTMQRSQKSPFKNKTAETSRWIYSNSMLAFTFYLNKEVLWVLMLHMWHDFSVLIS